MNWSLGQVPDWLDVSRETRDDLETLLALVRHWNRTINLVSAESLNDGWTRHILDSAQLLAFSNVVEGDWLDVGSGGGFPGLVVAVIAKEKGRSMRFTLVESDRRKCVFLSEAARKLGLQVNVISSRIEAMKESSAQVISARALAPLSALLPIARRHLSPSGIAIFPKGQSFGAELTAAREQWAFDCEVLPSRIDPSSVVLRIENIEHV